MKNTSALASSLFLLATLSLVKSLTFVTYNEFYDNANQSTAIIACADWAAANNFTTLADVPAFPFIGGASAVSGNTSACGTCFSILDEQTGITIEVTAVDAATNGFVVSLEALNAATENNAQNLGSIQASVTVAPSPDVCNP